MSTVQKWIYGKRCGDGRHRATPRAIVFAEGMVWIQWVTDGQRHPPAVVTSSHKINTPDMRHVCLCLLGEDRPANTVVPKDLLGHVCVIEVQSYGVAAVSPDPARGTADLSGDPLHGVYLPVEDQEDSLRWQKLDLPRSARDRIEAALYAAVSRPSIRKAGGRGKEVSQT